MRRLVWLTALACMLAAPAAGFALAGDADGTLSVKAGIGKVYLNFNGSAVGRVQRGSILVTDPVPGDGIGFDFSNCDVEKDRSETTSFCRGTNLHFRAIGGKYQILVRGAGIYLSAVGRGQVALDGRGEYPTVDSDGAYSLNDGAYKSLPNFGLILSLAPPSGGA